jgi:DNA-binding PadR family transcriptional regulator
LTKVLTTPIIISLSVITDTVIFSDVITEIDIPEVVIMLSSNDGVPLTEAVYYILLALYEPLHGYGIMQKVELFSQGRVRLAAGTLYGALATLLDKGWIQALSGEKNSRKKEYIATELGKSAVTDEISRLRELLRNGEIIAGADEI